MERIINVHVLINKRTGLLLAESDDLPGLHVVARDEAQLMERVPEAIRLIMEADGASGVTVRQLNGGASGGFAAPNEHQFQAMAA